MKRLLSLFVLITYMASAIQFSFSLHYCAGHYHGICFSADTEKDCCGENEKETNCCNDKVVKAQFKDDHFHSYKVILSSIAVVGDITPPTTYVVRVNTPTPQDHRRYVTNNSSPPFVRGVPIYVANRVFRI